MRVFVLAIWLVAILQAETLDAKIARMMKASPSERFKLMNAIKRDLVKLKLKERIAALKRLQQATRNKQTKKAIDEIINRQKRLEQASKPSLQTRRRAETHTENIIENTLDMHQTTETDIETISPNEEYDDDDD